MKQTKKWKYKIPKFTRCSKSSSQKEVHSDICLHQEKREILNNYTSLKGRKRRANEAQSQQKEITNIRAEINEIENRKTIEESMKELVL